MTTTIAPHPALKTRITQLFGIDYPIVQTGMGYVSDARLTAATSAAGGLGIIGSGLMSYEELAEAIATVQSLTDKPFGVNVRANQPDVEKRIDLLIRCGVKVASFALAPRQDLIARCKDGGLVVVPSIGAVRHAEKVKAWGADAVVVQGAEGGGHTGVVPTSLLLPQVAGAVDIAVIGAGGFFDGRGLVAALAYGAAGIAMGTRFLLTRESPVAPAVKELYLTKKVTDTVVTSEIDGVPQRLLNAGQIGRLQATSAPRRVARAIRSAVLFHQISGTSWPDMIREGIEMKKEHDLPWTQVIMAANAPVLYRSVLLNGRTDIGVSASGQVVGLIDDIPSCAELIERIVREANEVLARLGGPR
ncbi:nitronate monooxygenase [Trebonia kvetii]|uniref:Nitronate monooxygenase n=1 Tax=Trebonia kvetii TaxID=2480626 RepID=A0A6P2BVG7_9ACTN|nr:nitronate monooxygenase [Trebonia kvetii]TVZ02135.1 nitronate monooxygenase [Trebonia kvetii]